MNRQSWMGITGVALIATALIVGLRPAPETPPGPPPGPPPVRVVLPGRPGESATVSDSDQVRAPDGSTYNSIDVTYAQMMIAHHAQAISMAGLAPSRSGSAALTALAGRISAAQQPEVAVLRSWLKDRGKSETTAGHDHSGMPGMQSAAAILSLIQRSRWPAICCAAARTSDCPKWPMRPRSSRAVRSTASTT